MKFKKTEGGIKISVKEFMDDMILGTPKELKEAKKWFKKNSKALEANGGSIVNNDRRHDERRDFANIQTLEQRQDGKYFDNRLLKAVRSEKRLLDEIFSKRWEDLHELVSNEQISMAIKNLSDYQKQILFWNVIHEYTTVEIAENFGVTDRNIRDVRQRALVSIREQIGAPLNVRYKKIKKKREPIYKRKNKNAMQ